MSREQGKFEMIRKGACSRGLTRRAVLKVALYGGVGALFPGNFWLMGCGKKSPREKPNIVLILIDALRPDFLSFYGYRKNPSRFLSMLAEKSVVFMRAFAPSSWTAPSTASLFTSQYPNQHGVTEGFFCYEYRRAKSKSSGEAKISLNSLPKEQPTIPEVLKSFGYTTFGIAANINVGREIGFHRGFDRFEHNHQATADVFFKRIMEWKGKIKDSEPFFLYLHFNDVHWPYHIRPPYYEAEGEPRKDLQARYLSEIGYADEYIGRIYEELNLEEDSVLIVVSDHGEEFWDHGGNLHRAKLYRELTQVLLFFHAPSLGFKPGRIDGNVNLIDVLPTLVELVTGRRLEGMEGISLVPLLRPGRETESLKETLSDRILFSHRVVGDESGNELWSAIYQNWNLIEWWDSRKELYDHRGDFQEKHNVFSETQEVSSRLHEELQKFKNQAQRKDSNKIEVKLNSNLLEALRSLGYVE